MSENSDHDFVSSAFAKMNPIEPSAALSRKVATIPLQFPRGETQSWWPFGSFVRPTFALLAAAFLGFLSAGELPGNLSEPETFDEMSFDEAAFLDSTPALNAVGELAAQEEADLEGLLALALTSDFGDDAWGLGLDDGSRNDEASPQ